MTEISLRDISKEYDGKHVIEDLNLTIPSGSLAVIVGPSGCGKSTLLRMIAGLTQISSGDLVMGGERMNDVEPSDRGCAMVFQNYALYPHMTVTENLGYPLKIARIPRQERDQRIRAAAEMLGLGDYLDRRPSQLSGGQRQRVAMGRAIVRNPEIFLFDEPLSNLDAKLRGQMRLEIKQLHRKLGATSVFVTHDQVEAMTMADLLIVMNKGLIEQAGAPDEVYANPASVFVADFIGSPPISMLDARSAGASHISVAGIDMPLPDMLTGRVNGGPITVGLRPEDVSLSTGSEGVAARVELIENLGASHVAFCRADSGERISALLGKENGIREGSDVRLNWRPDSMHIFQGETGRRILAE